MTDPILNRLVAEGKTAPRVTMEHIESIITSEHYFTAEQGSSHDHAVHSWSVAGDGLPALGLLTFCVLTLRNGFTVTGQSACASAENFDAVAGREYARKDAVNKVWPLEGYLLRQRLHSNLVDRSGKLEIMPDPTAIVPEGLSDEQVARVCHEVNRAYCAALGDHSQAAWEDAPEWQRSSARMGVDLHRMLPDAGPEASHISWCENKFNDGWVYGPVKDESLKQHPCLVPFYQLEPAQQAKDFIFKAVVNALTPL